MDYQESIQFLESVKSQLNWDEKQALRSLTNSPFTLYQRMMGVVKLAKQVNHRINCESFQNSIEKLLND